MVAQRKIPLLPLLLSITLIVLVGAKFFRFLHPITLFPQYTTDVKTLTASDQANKQQANSNVRLIALVDSTAPTPQSTFGTPVQATCDPNAPITPPPQTSDLANTPSSCESTDEINIANYITPQCIGESCGTFQGTSVTLEERREGNMSYYVENIGNGRVIQHSNDSHFVYENDGSNIRLLQDSIWDGGPSNGEFMCTNGKGSAFYRAYEASSGKWGIPIYPTKAKCGQPTPTTGYLKAFPKKWGTNDIKTVTNNLASEQELGLEACSVSGQAIAENPTAKTSPTANKLIFQGSAKCMNQDLNMISFVVTDGAGKGEVSMFAEGKGLVAWYQELDFSKAENNPNQWKGKDLCKLGSVAYGNSKQGNLPTYFEYNLQREFQCKQTPEKVLSNFLDEYSVTCMPKSAYMLDLINRENCGQTTKGCLNWNATGELKFTPGNTLFGLYRDEAAVTTRYPSTNNQASKLRNESIESYFTSNPGSTSGPGRSSGSTNKQLIGSSAVSPLFSNTSLAEQCRLIYNKLDAVKELCDPINRISGDKGSECAINQYLPNSSTRYLDVLNNIGSASRCESIMLSDNETRQQVLQVDPSMEVAYRPAFVVVATLVNDSENINNPFVRAPGTSASQPKFWQLDYLELKVPTFGSDFLDKETSTTVSNPDRPGGSYIDPLRYTADVLTSTETQEQFRKEEEEERNTIRDEVNNSKLIPTSDGPLKYNETNPLIGNSDAPIKCRSEKGNYSEVNCDNIARALVSFINASVAMTPKEDSLHRQFTPAREWLPSSAKCDVDESVLYGNAALNQKPVEDKYKVSEQAGTLGSKLEAKDVGGITKKKTASVDIDVIAPDLSKEVQKENISTTRIFFVSPHQYTLLYAQSAMMSLLTSEQQADLMRDENFPAVLKAPGMDTLDSDKVYENYLDKSTALPTEQDTDLPPANPALSAGTQYQSGIQIQRQKEGDITKESPVMWQSAASVANLFTRYVTLLTTNPGDPAYDRTIACTGPNATELWLKGNCSPKAAGDVPGAKEDIKTDTTASNRCFQVYVDDKAEARALADAVRKNILTPKVKGFFERFMQPTPRINLFYQDPQCGNKYCFDYIMDRAIAETNINPQYIVSLALTESEGLKNNNPDDPLDPVGTHFGCGKAGKIFYPGVIIDGKLVGKQEIGSQTLDEKFRCLVNFFESNKNLSPDELVRRHGSANGIRNKWHNQFIVLLSGGTSKNACETPDIL